MSHWKSWLLLPVGPALMTLHYHTQWQGLLNVLGVIYFLVFLLSAVVALGIIICWLNGVKVPDLGALSEELPKPLLVVSWMVMAGITGYLFWTGHVVVGSIYLLASFAGYFAYLLARVNATQQ